jgi:hypothetical protein
MNAIVEGMLNVRYSVWDFMVTLLFENLQLGTYKISRFFTAPDPSLPFAALLTAARL